MSTYAIGDVQGCLDPLLKLLEIINFNPKHDTLWFVGDIINRGPKSLETLKLIKRLNAKVVLGNHDLHLLAVHYGMRKCFEDDTLEDILAAPEREELIDWLRQQPLMHYDEKSDYAMVHAGIAPMWDLQQALNVAEEVSKVLKSPDIQDYLKHMYGNEPNIWDDSLTGYTRLRVITNYLTRLRFCDAQGHLDLKIKNLDCPPNFYPWFLTPNRKTENQNIIFGHWAALDGNANHPHVFALDTGAVWGRRLTAMCLETQERFSVANSN